MPGYAVSVWLETHTQTDTHTNTRAHARVIVFIINRKPELIGQASMPLPSWTAEMIASYAAAPSNHSQVQLIVTHTYRVRVLNTEGTKHRYHKHVISHRNDTGTTRYHKGMISHRNHTGTKHKKMILQIILNTDITQYQTDIRFRYQ